MDVERVKHIWWIERDPWGRYLKWSGDGQGFFRQEMLPAIAGPGKVELTSIGAAVRMSSQVWRSALQRAMAKANQPLVTDDPEEVS